MNLLSFLFVFFSSVVAFAAPVIGDYVRFQVKIEENGTTQIGQYEVTLLAIDSIGNLRLRTVITMENGPAQINAETVLSKNVLAEEDYQRLFPYCEDYGRRKDKYILPNSLIIDTCVIPSDANQGQPTGEIHLAEVPFGIVKQIQIDTATGLTITQEMMAFTKAK